MPNQNPLSQETQDEITNALSTVRLQPYIRAANGQIDNAIKIYTLNLELCAALYPSLNIFEITFRNQINRVLQERYGSNGENWYEVVDFIQEHGLESIEKAKNNVRLQKKPLTRNRIVSELTLGFWSAFLIKKHYKQSVFNRCIEDIFPYAQASDRNFSKIAPLFQSHILLLRNRIFHHEPIWFPNYQVEQKHEYLCKVLGWMNTEVLSWLQTYDRFPSVYKNISDELNKLTLSTRATPAPPSLKNKNFQNSQITKPQKP